jgi:hypothetical protein
MLDSSSEHVTAIAKQRPLYYCVCIVKSKCFLAYFPYFWGGGGIKAGLWNHLALCLSPPPPIVARQQLGKHIHAETNTQTTT